MAIEHSKEQNIKVGWEHALPGPLVLLAILVNPMHSINPFGYFIAHAETSYDEYN